MLWAIGYLLGYHQRQPLSAHRWRLQLGLYLCPRALHRRPAAFPSLLEDLPPDQSTSPARSSKHFRFTSPSIPCAKEVQGCWHPVPFPGLITAMLLGDPSLVEGDQSWLRDHANSLATFGRTRSTEDVKRKCLSAFIGREILL